MTSNLKFVSSSVAQKQLRVAPQTLRRWANAGKIAALRTPGGHYRYCLDKFIEEYSLVAGREEKTGDLDYHFSRLSGRPPSEL